MARLVAGFGSSHSPMLAAQVEDWVEGAFVGRDRARQFVDFEGKPCRYDDLLATRAGGCRVRASNLRRCGNAMPMCRRRSPDCATTSPRRGWTR